MSNADVINYLIPVQNMGRFTELMDKLTKKGVELGFDEDIGFIELGEERTEDAKGRVHRFMRVAVYGTTPRMKGYEFIASIEHTKEGLQLVREARGKALPAELRTMGPVCHHCFQKRFRKSTFMLQHEDQSFVSVGSTCLKDFLGYAKNPDQIAKWMELASSITAMETAPEEDERERGSMYVSYPAEYSLERFLLAVAIDMKLRGHYFKNTEFGPPSTSYIAGHAIDMYWHKEEFQMVNDIVAEMDSPAAETYKPLVDATIEWAKNLTDEQVADMSYLFNIRTIAKQGYVTFRTLGLAASMVTAYNRSKPKPAEEPKPVKKPSEHIGVKGKRMDCEVNVLKIKAITGYNYRYDQITKDMVTMEDSEGNRIVWFCEGNNPLKAGDKVKVRMTVKEHDVYKGTNQTTVNRVALA